MLTPSLSLRPTSLTDQAFCQRLFTQVKSAELSIGGDENTQLASLLSLQFAAHERHYQQISLPLTDHLIFLTEGNQPPITIGRQIVWREERSLHLADLSILAEYRHQGHGSALLHALQQQAQAENLAVTLRCSPANPALRLYQRSGWQVIDTADPVQLLLRWSGN